MINVIICEDNMKDRKRTIKVVNDFFTKRKIDYLIHEYNDYSDNLYNIIKSPIPFKIYLLDIETPSRSGIDVAREIRRKDVDSIIIFLTAHEELTSTASKNELMFLNYINKFDNFDKMLISSLNKSLKSFKKKQIVKIIDKNISYTIDLDNILYISKDSYERKTIIKTDYNEIKINKTLIETLKLLDGRFIQTHRSCYINNDRKYKVDLTNKIITFDNGETIDLLSDKYKKGII